MNHLSVGGNQIASIINRACKVDFPLKMCNMFGCRVVVYSVQQRQLQAVCLARRVVQHLEPVDLAQPR